MTKRITISVDEQTAQRLRELAGSQRKQGEYITKMVNAMYENQATGVPGMAMEELRLKYLGLTTELHDVKHRLMALEQMTGHH